jgi:uncharacterized membrane protein
VELDRLVFFSDAVFAIAITLLVIEIKVPTGAEDVGAALLDRWPQFLSFVLSFLVIGIFWVAHHRMFGYIARVDTRLLWINLFLLMCVAFLPFPTAVLGDHDNNRASVVFYAGSMALVGLASASVWRYASQAGLLDDRADDRIVQYFSLRSVVVPASFLASIPFAFVDTRAAEALWFAPFALIALVSRRHAKASLR